MSEILLILPVFKILLTILKIIGIVILCVIGLVILIILIVSWVPIRYDAGVEKKSAFRLSAGVSWFLRAFSFRFFMNEEGSGTVIKLFGKTLSESSSGETEEDKAEEKSEGEKAESPPGEGIPESSGEEAPQAAPAAPEKPPEESAVGPPENAESLQESAESHEEKPQEESPPVEEAHEEEPAASGKPPEDTSGEAQESAENAEEEVFIDEKIDDFLDNIQVKYLEFEDKWEGLRDKYEFLTCEQAMREYGRALKNIGKILKHILPNRLNGHIRFGFDSPALTGKILAYYCMLAPVHKYALIPEPEFTEKVIEGDAELTGRIFLGYIILKALAIVLNLDTLYLIRNFRKHFRK